MNYEKSGVFSFYKLIANEFIAPIETPVIDVYIVSFRDKFLINDYNAPA